MTHVNLIQEMGRLVSLQLWQCQAIEVNVAKPFRLVSGNYSPIYIDCRKLISSVFFVDLFTIASRLIFESEQVEFDVVAGGETAGIPFAAFLARAFACPLIYVRKKQKSYGIPSRVEGILPEGKQVLLVEDLITDGGSKLSFIQGIRESKGVVNDVLVVFDRLQGGREAIAKENVRLHALTDIDLALAEAENGGLLSIEELQIVREYLRSPQNWSKLTE